MKLQHRHGGKITAITAVAHETYKGVASWHFIGDVEWSDGSKSVAKPIEPFLLVCNAHDPEAKAECDALMAKMTDYLGRVGEWHEQRKAPGGRMTSWTPRQKKGSEVLA